MDQEGSSDYFVSSYTPTLTALLRAQQGSRMFPSAHVKVLTIAAVNAHSSIGPRLRYVPQEVQALLEIAEKAGASCRSEEGLSAPAHVLNMINSTNMVHFACHGNQHHSEPHESHFCLTTGNLSVSELMKADMKDAFFAFLSACETAKGDSVHADEVVHLAATMLFAGFRSVVATMWFVTRPVALE